MMMNSPYSITKGVNEDTIIAPDLKNKWYIFYTAPRAEKVVCQELARRGYEVFLPTVKILKVWKNRQKKTIDQVLFPSYIFVKTEEYMLHFIKQVPKIATYIHCAGKPSVIKQKEIECIKKMLRYSQEISVETNFSVGEQVRITCGPFSGYSGILVEKKGKKRFGINLKDINQTIFIDICASMLA